MHSWELEGPAEGQEQEKALGAPWLQLEVSRSEGGAEDKAEVHCMAMKAKVEEVQGKRLPNGSDAAEKGGPPPPTTHDLAPRPSPVIGEVLVQ